MDTLKRLNTALGRTEEQYLTALASSFMVSADNAHGVHPNYTDKADPTNRPYLNGGIVIKFNANQKYTTDAVSAAVFRSVCEKADVPVQTFTNRSDMAGGSTLGNISNTHVALNTVDIGLPELAMHSPYETGGETLLRNGLADLGYRWALTENGLPVLAKDGRNQMSPIKKAEKRIQNGPEDSVKSFYDVAKVIAQGKLIPGRRTGEPGAEEESR